MTFSPRHIERQNFTPKNGQQITDGYVLVTSVLFESIYRDHLPGKKIEDRKIPSP